MGLLDRFRGKKKEEVIVEGTQVRSRVTELQEVCGDDRETYEALLNTMFLDPRKIDVSIKEAVENAKESEKSQNRLRAKIWYEIAGGLAIYKGNVDKVTEYFSEGKKVVPKTKYSILKNTEQAVAKAQEYYRKYLKD